MKKNIRNFVEKLSELPPKKMIIFSAGILTGVLLSGYMVSELGYNLGKKNVTGPVVTPDVYKPNYEIETDDIINDLSDDYEKEKIEQLEQSDLESLYLGDYEVYLSEMPTAYTEGFAEFNSSADTVMQLAEHFSYARFDYVASNVKSIMKEANLTNVDNSQIYAMMGDANLMHDWNDVARGVREAKLSGHKSVIGIAVDTLFASYRRREAVIVDLNSVSPYVEGAVIVNNVTEIVGDRENIDKLGIGFTIFDSVDDEKRFEENRLLHPELLRLFSVYMTINGDESIECLVSINKDATLSIIGYYGADYPTVAKFIEWGIDND